MKRFTILTALVPSLWVASAAASTLTVTPDKSSYAVGEIVTLSIDGDPHGGTDDAIFGRLLFDPALATGLSATQNQLFGAGGAIPWTLGSVGCGTGFCTVFDQTAPGVIDANNHLIASATLRADAPGTVSVSWDASLDFFGLTTAPGTSFLITPEPATGALLGLCLVALAAVRRCDPEAIRARTEASHRARARA